MNSFENICHGKVFIIPFNQRGFSWKADNIVSIFADLLLAGDSAHYMGPIIVSRTDNDGFQDDNYAPFLEYTLEDGQQRFTSFIIIVNEIMRALQKKLPDISPKEKQRAEDSIRELHKILYHTRGERDYPILENENKDLHGCFMHVLDCSSPLPANDSPPKTALLSAKKTVEDYLENTSVDDLIAWKSKILNRAKFIFVDLKQERVNRYLTFDAINSRGLTLSEFDKIKNFCILVDQVRKLETKPESCWYKAIVNLEKHSSSSRSQEATFISELFNSFHNEKVSQNDVHTAFVAKYRHLLESSDSASEKMFIDFISLWTDYANSYGFFS